MSSTSWLNEGDLGSFRILGSKLKMQTHMIPTLPSCYLVPPTILLSSKFFSFTSLRRTMKFGGRNVGAQGFLRKPSTNFLKLHHSLKTHSMDFNGEMTQHQDSPAQWRHVDGQDQSALLISSKIAPASLSVCDSLPSLHGHCRGC